MSDFVHLHSHGEFSLLDGLTKATDAVRVIAADGQVALALTDHGSLGGQQKMALAAAEAGIKHIPGIEAFLAIGSRTERNAVWIPAEDDFDGDEKAEGTKKRKTYEHLTMLARNAEGWRNLQLLNLEATKNFWSRPRMDRDLLADHAAGIIVGSGCLSGPVAGKLLLGEDSAAADNLDWLVQTFGRDYVFVEVMSHGLPAEQRVIPGLIRLSQRFGLPLVATGDAHYATADQQATHDIWLCSGKKKNNKPVTVNDPDRWKFGGTGYHLSTAAEMHAFWDTVAGAENAVANSVRIADMIDDNIVLSTVPPEGQHYLPELPVPEQFHGDAGAWMHQEVRLGLVRRYGSPLPDEVKARARWEEDVIRGFGMSAYMLVKKSVIDRARARGVLIGPGRGCLVGNTPIWTARGMIPLSSVVPGDLVRTHTGAVRVVEKTFAYPCDETLVTVRSWFGGHVTMTSDHKTLVRRGDNVSWVPAGDIAAGDWVCVPRPENPRWGIDAWCDLCNDAAWLDHDGRWTRLVDTADEADRLSAAIGHLGLPVAVTAFGDRWQVDTVSGLVVPDPENCTTDDAYVYLRVTGTESADPAGTVYDIQVAVDHSFTTDSFIVHNSATGSITAYALGITQVDPLKYGLRFDRFLDPARASLPDIDTDFQSSMQESVMAETADVFGQDMVARIGTYGKSKAKESLKKVGRVTERTPLATSLAKLVPSMIEDQDEVTLSALLDPSVPEGAQFRDAVANDPQAADLVQAAIGIEGSPFSTSVHACGVVIGQQPLPGQIPLRVAPVGDHDQFLITEYEAAEVERQGLVKYDFLALKDLDVVQTCAQLIEQTTGEHVDPYAIVADPPADADQTYLDRCEKTWSMLADGRTSGVFQLAGGGITQLCRDVHPTNLTDLSAILALYRPGPMGEGMHKAYAARKQGVDKTRYENYTDRPEEAAVLAQSLESTLGAIVFQESIMQLSVDVADFDPANANKLRKAISKKKIHVLNEELHPAWDAGGRASVRRDGTPKVAFQQSTLDTLWRTFQASGRYLFNACLPGDTTLENGRGVPWTIERLYHRIYGDLNVPLGVCPYCGERESQPQRGDRRCGACVSWIGMFRSPRRGFHLLAWDDADDRIRPQRVKDVHCNGVQPVFTITLSDGKTVTATKNHRFLTPDGWTTVDRMVPGIELCVDGGDAQSVDKAPEHIMSTSTVVSILPAGETMTYDVEMAENTTHSFIANGVVSHNSHTYGYATVSFWTAFLKANWPAHFGAALLIHTDRDEKRRMALADLRRDGIAVDAPDINIAGLSTGVTSDGHVMLGLSEVKDVGVEAAKIVAERDARGPFRDLQDLWRRTKITSKVIIALAEAGSLDAFGPRAGITMVARAMASEPEIPNAQWGVLEQAARQRDRLKVLVGDHPLDVLRPQIGEWLIRLGTDRPVLYGPDRVPADTKSPVNVIGVVESVERVQRNDGFMIKTVLGSANGQIETVTWPSQAKAMAAIGMRDPEPGDLLVMHGRVRTYTPMHDDTDPNQAPPDPVVSVVCDRWTTPTIRDMFTPPTAPASCPATVETATEQDVAGPDDVADEPQPDDPVHEYVDATVAVSDLPTLAMPYPGARPIPPQMIPAAQPITRRDGQDIVIWKVARRRSGRLVGDQAPVVHAIFGKQLTRLEEELLSWPESVPDQGQVLGEMSIPGVKMIVEVGPAAVDLSPEIRSLLSDIRMRLRNSEFSDESTSPAAGIA